MKMPLFCSSDASFIFINLHPSCHSRCIQSPSLPICSSSFIPIHCLPPPIHLPPLLTPLHIPPHSLHIPPSPHIPPPLLLLLHPHLFCHPPKPNVMSLAHSEHHFPHPA